MIDLVSLSSGQQVALAVAVNVASLVMLWGPYTWFRWHYRNTKNISWRARVGLFILFAILFTLFWWGYLYVSRLVIDSELNMTMRDVLNSNLLIEISSFISFPVYLHFLFFENRKKSRHMFRILIISLGVLVSFAMYLGLVGVEGIRFGI